MRLKPRLFLRVAALRCLLFGFAAPECQTVLVRLLLFFHAGACFSDVAQIDDVGAHAGCAAQVFLRKASRLTTDAV